MCPKIVQKYIERPLLINKRKFDIRQWVYVNSFDPLEVMIYNQAYLRICSKEFDIS
jgi:tubulin monoglycylase TTLL3/8